MRNKYYSLAQDGAEATINIYGDITSWDWYEGDMSSYTLSKELSGLDADTIHIHINSYGGEVAEGLAIYNMLKQHKAKIKTYCDGFACSIASVIFMAGDERIMSNASLLMIHKPWVSYVSGNSDELTKIAEDLEVMEKTSIAAYMDGGLTISEDELRTMLADEKWILAADAVNMGFATSMVGTYASKNPSQSAGKEIYNLVLSGLKTTRQQEPPQEPKTEPWQQEPEPKPKEPEEPEAPKPQKQENKLIKILAAIAK